MVSQSLGESEGMLTHGFDTAVKKIIDKRNWNLQLLGGYIDDNQEIHCDNKPRIAIYQVFSERGFELHAIPYAKDQEIDQYVKGNRLMEFNLWDPLSMRLLLRVNQLHKFIGYYFEHGDDADFAAAGRRARRMGRALAALDGFAQLRCPCRIGHAGRAGDVEAFLAAKRDIVCRYGSDIHLSFMAG